LIQDKLYRQKTIYKLNLTTQTQDNAVLLQTTVMVRCGSLKTKRVMKIEQIIYDTTRNVLNIEDKLSIATLFLFCEKIGT